MLSLNGRVAGISGIVGGLIEPRSGDVTGVCGISPLSKRSLVATLTFMVSGAGSAYVVQHVLLSEDSR